MMPKMMEGMTPEDMMDMMHSMMPKMMEFFTRARKIGISSKIA
jgi:hypothetical protein